MTTTTVYFGHTAEGVQANKNNNNNNDSNEDNNNSVLWSYCRKCPG